MKKVFQLGILVLCAATLFACAEGAPEETKGTTWQTEPVQTKQPLQTTAPAETDPVPTEPPTTQAVYIPEIYPDAVGIYIPADDGTKARVLVTEFTAQRKAKTDIDCFEVFASEESRITGTSFSSMWQTAWDVFEDTQDTKIGFHISFTLDSGEVISQTVLKPGDAKWFYDYLEIYLYDDINQTPGVRYTHLEESQIGEDTVISSIKLTSGSKIDQVGEILLTAFLYNGDDCFDENGNYLGRISATVLIKEP